MVSSSAFVFFLLLSMTNVMAVSVSADTFVLGSGSGTAVGPVATPLYPVADSIWNATGAGYGVLPLAVSLPSAVSSHLRPHTADSTLSWSASKANNSGPAPIKKHTKARAVDECECECVDTQPRNSATVSIASEAPLPPKRNTTAQPIEDDVDAFLYRAIVDGFVGVNPENGTDMTMSIVSALSAQTQKSQDTFPVSPDLTLVSTGTSSGCGKTPIFSNAREYKLSLRGHDRSYFVRIPPNYNPWKAYRLIFTMHAFRGSATAVKNGDGAYTAWYGLADQPGANDAIFVAPNGLAGTWLNPAGEDVQFVRRLIRTVESRLCIDRSQRYMHGFSFGASMTYAVTCAMGNEFRAVSMWSGAPISGCVGMRPHPVPYYGQHGIRDGLLPLTVGRGLRNQFLSQNGCKPKATETPERGSGRRTFTEYECDEGFPVVWVEFDDGHTQSPTDAGARTSWAPGYTWDFFSRFF